MRNVTETVKHLLIINVIFFFATISIGDKVYDWFALHYFGNPKFQPWQVISHMFMHGDFAHIFFNMFGLWMFGIIAFNENSVNPPWSSSVRSSIN